jgi:hypothetical protein
VRQHHTLGTTPTVAAGLEEKPWSLEKVVEMTEDYMQRNSSWFVVHVKSISDRILEMTEAYCVTQKAIGRT